MSFSGPPEAYDDYMGRYSRLLSPQFAARAGVHSGIDALDVGCGPGALTAVLLELGAVVSAVDPSQGYAAACAARHPGADVRHASAEALPWADGSFDVAAAQLVVHFMADPVVGVREMARVVRPGGVVAGCTWDTAGGMGLHEVFWAGVEACGLPVPAERGSQRYGSPDELRGVWTGSGLLDVEVLPLDVEVEYDSEPDFWHPFTGATGPTGAYLATLTTDQQAALRAACGAVLHRLGFGRPDGSVRVPARSWAVRGRTPARVELRSQVPLRS